MRLDWTFFVVLLCFLLSGFAGLLFQTVWTRQFSLVFGTTELAVATVLAAYMGGLAAGAAAARRWVLRARRPLRAYGLLELGIGASALAVPAAIRASTLLSAALFGGQPAPPPAAGLPLSIFYLACSFVILLLPTAFMGATLPLLTRFAVQREDQVGSRIALLYAINTAGAVAGVLTTAFWILPNTTLANAVWIGVAINVGVFGLASLVARSAPPSPSVRAVAPPGGLRLRGREWILLLILLSGVTSFSYEVLWTRLLGHLFGGTVYAFGTMLASFLTGIALGSAVASRLAGSRERALHGFSITQLGIAACSLGSFVAVDRLPALALRIGAGTHAGLWSNAAVAALVLLPAALFIGASFPLAVRVLARDEVDASPASARVYAWNTVGAIIGAVGAGFVWIPLLDFHGTLAAAVAINLLLAGAAALLLEQPRRRFAMAAGASALAVLILGPGPPWRLLLTSPFDLIVLEPERVEPEDVVYFAPGRSSTVLLFGDSRGWTLRTNGLPEAGILPRGFSITDNTTQWLGALPVLARPDARSMLVIGLGGGTTLEAIPPSIESIDVIELEPEVLDANRKLSGLRTFDPLQDPRVRIRLNDARGALQLTDRRYDAIVSQPSHPWTAGASHLFTREFFALVGDHLTTDGVFVQWMGVWFLDEPLLRSMVATLNETFPYVRLYWLRTWDAILFVASPQPLPVEQASAVALARAPRAFSHLAVHGPEDVATVLALDEADAREFGAGAPVSTDAHNIFQFRSPRAMRAPLHRQALTALMESFDPLFPPDPDWDVLRLARRLVERRDFARAERMVGYVQDPVDRFAIRGLLQLYQGRSRRGEASLRDALRIDPNAWEPRVALARVVKADEVLTDPLTADRAEPYPELAAVLEGWKHAERGDWQAVESLDEILGRTLPRDALYPDATRLRIRWRIDSGGLEEGREALAMVDVLIPISHAGPDAILRARAANRAGYPGVALDTFEQIIGGLGLDNPHNILLLDKLGAAMAEIAEGGPNAAKRREVAAALTRRRFEFRDAMPEHFREDETAEPFVFPFERGGESSRGRARAP